MGHSVSNGRRVDPQVAKGVRARMLQVVLVLSLYGAVLFVGAGSLRWPAAWALLAIYVAAIGANIPLMRRNPDLIAERGTTKENVKSWDRVLGLWVGFLGPLALLLVAALDRRFGWSAAIPAWLQGAGLVLVAAGYAIWDWAMASNSFFSGLVRIQDDRGHAVASTGPYRIVRHPGYAGGLLFTLAMPVGLGAWWALVPAAVTIVAFFVRTALEDRTLQEELPGYREFAQTTRQRLIPGVW
jgi:protein-S-isoprenylcysteine O-methyltransferase Ste14